MHRVDAAIREVETPVPLAGHVERGNVVTDVVSHNDAVFQIVDEHFQRVLLLHSSSGLVPGHTMYGHCAGMAGQFEHGLVGVLEQDLAISYGDCADGDNAVVEWIESGCFTIQHDETNTIDRSVVAPGCFETL